jgi:hypothetical protein
LLPAFPQGVGGVTPANTGAPDRRLRSRLWAGPAAHRHAGRADSRPPTTLERRSAFVDYPGHRLDSYIEEEITNMSDEPKRDVPQGANRDGLASVAIAVLAIALIIFLIVKL